jgi:hypothetical protein
VRAAHAAGATVVMVPYRVEPSRELRDERPQIEPSRVEARAWLAALPT